MDIPKLSQKKVKSLELLIAKGEMYGLDLWQHRPGHQARYGLRDPGLHGRQGYVESRQESAEGGMGGLPRRPFRVTGHSKRVFHVWEMADAAFAFGSESYA